MRVQALVPFVGLLSAVSAYPSPNFGEKCAALANNIQLDYPFNVNIAEYLAPNATIDHRAEGMNETCFDSLSLSYPIPVGVCRLNLRVNINEKSEVYMEAWLPENWTGRVMTTGNGGFGGCIMYGELAYGASYGFASFGTNAGHNGTSGGAFYNQPEVLEDFAERAVFTGATVGKVITKQFYQQEHKKSYYLGCSSGGRLGWKAVQQNPDLFDGVVAGAPAFGFFKHLAFLGHAIETLGFSANETIVSPRQWQYLQAEVYKQCDALDGAQDNILEDPAACKLDWTPLLCSNSSNASATCFTPEQAEAATKLFAPITYNGTELHPGISHGFEVETTTLLYTPLVLNWVSDAFRYMIYQDDTWDRRTFTLEDAVAALQANPSNLHTWDADISAFRNRGGKILHWHGAADSVLDMRMSDLYYSRVQSTLNATVAELDDFYRYFHASGVAHCAGGPGASFMGQMGRFDASKHPDDNMLMRIVEWVENGDAPEFVRGTKFVNDTKALGVAFTRKHCKYPMVNMYRGAGNGTDEEGWECVEREAY